MLTRRPNMQHTTMPWGGARSSCARPRSPRGWAPLNTRDAISNWKDLFCFKTVALQCRLAQSSQWHYLSKTFMLLAAVLVAKEFWRLRQRAYRGLLAFCAATLACILILRSVRKPKDGGSEESRVEVAKDDISSLSWATIGKSQQFRVHRFDGVEER